MDEFEQTWQALYENGSSGKNKEATKRFWDTLTPAQQHQAFLSITRKVRENKFVQYDPIRAIKENIRRMKAQEPENLNGTRKVERLIKTTKLVIARYKGAFGTYTLTDAERYAMDILRGLNFDYASPP